MKVTLINDYWVLADSEKEFFLQSDDNDYCDWVTQIKFATKFPSESGALHYNSTRNYDLINKEELLPVKVKVTYEF